MKISLRGKISLGLTGSIPRVIVGSTGQASTGYLEYVSNWSLGSGTLPQNWTFVRTGSVQVQTSDSTISSVLGSHVPAVANSSAYGRGLELDVSSVVYVASRVVTSFPIGGTAPISSGLVGPSGDGNVNRLILNFDQKSNYAAVASNGRRKICQQWVRAFDTTTPAFRGYGYAPFSLLKCVDSGLPFDRSTSWSFLFTRATGNAQHIPVSSQLLVTNAGVTFQDVCVDYLCFADSSWPIKYPTTTYDYEQLNVPVTVVSGSSMLRLSFCPKGIPADYAGIHADAFYVWRVDDNNRLYVSSSGVWNMVVGGTSMTGTLDVWNDSYSAKPQVVNIRSMFTPSGSRVEMSLDDGSYFTLISSPLNTTIPWANSQLIPVFYKSAVHRLYEVETRGGSDVTIKPEIFSFDTTNLSKGPLNSQAFSALGQSRYTCASTNRYVTTSDINDETIELVPCIDDAPIGSWGLHVMPGTTNRILVDATEDVLALTGSGVGFSTSTSSLNRPNNTPNAQRVQVNSGGSSYSNYLSISSLSNTYRVASVYLKEGSPGGLYQIYMSMGATPLAAGGVAGSVWKRRAITTAVTNTNVVYLPVEGRDRTASGGITAGSRDVLLAHMQVEDGLCPTEFQPVSQTRAAARWYIPVMSSRGCVPVDGRLRFRIRLRPQFLLLNAAGLYSINVNPRLIDMSATARVYLQGTHGSGANLAKVGINLGASSIFSTNAYAWSNIADSTTYVEYAMAIGGGTTIIKVKKMDGVVDVLENSQVISATWPRDTLIDIMQTNSVTHFIGGCDLLKFYERDADLFVGEYA